MTEEDGELTLGRYTLHGEIASGGMATVYLGRLRGPVGFSRVVAVKRMHPHVARDPDFAAMFLDEASLAAHIQHPNVVATLDVVANDDEAFIVMEYIKGASLAALLRDTDRKRIRVGIPIAVSLIIGALSGLHAAHEARTGEGKLLEIVHRDVSPQNVLVGLDGLARITDFGVAKAAIRSGVTRDNQIKGKICYMAPEQLAGRPVDRRADVFAAAAILWEMLAGRRLFTGEDTGAIVARVIQAVVPPLSDFRKDVPAELEAVLRRALDANLAVRFATAQDFADALEEAAPKLASQRTVGAWVKARAADDLARRSKLVTKIEEELSVGDAEGAPAAQDKPAAPRPAAGQPAPAPEQAPPASPEQPPAGPADPVPPASGAPVGAMPDEPAAPAPAAVAGWEGAPVAAPSQPEGWNAQPLATPLSCPGSAGSPGSAGPEMATPLSVPTMDTPASHPGGPAPISDPGMATPLSSPAMPTPLSSPAAPTPLSDPAMLTPLSGPAMPTPLSSPAAPTPLSDPAMLTPLSSPAMPTPLSTPNMPTPLSTAGASVSAFPEPTADVYASHERKRKLAILGAVTMLLVVGLSLAVLGGTSSSDSAEASDPAEETDEAPARAAAPPAETDPDEPDEPADSASTATTSVVAAPQPSASASASPADQPKRGTGTKSGPPRPPKGNYLPDMP